MDRGRIRRKPAIDENPEHASSPADRFTRLARKLVSYLRDDELREVADTFAEVIGLDRSRVGIARLKRAFSKADRLDLLLDLFLSERAEAGFGLALVAEAYVLGSAFERTAEVEKWMEARRDRIVTWSNYDYLKNLVPRSHPLVPRLRALKYPDLPDIRSSSDLVAYAETLAGRLVMSGQTLDNLYRCSRFRHLPREVWEQRVRVSFCIDHITGDIPRDLYRLFDQDVSKAALARLDTSRGNLLLAAHGGFTGLSIGWLHRAVPDCVFLVGKPEESRHRTKVFTEDVRAALFALHRALLDKQTVFLAPDSHIGSLQSSIAILGRERQLADGAAFLAYETGCATAWYAVVREGAKFTPVILAAPAREAGETYQHFKERLYGFYASQIESMMTGDPDNIVFKQGWMRELESL